MPQHSLTLAAWFHDLSPFLIRFTDTFGIRWYGLSYALGFLCAFLLMRRLCALGYTTLRKDQMGDLILTLILGVVLGGRIGYMLFYQPSLLWTFSGSFPFWGALQINNGGMASHGGMIGVIAIACWWVRRVNRERAAEGQGPVSMLHVLDVCALSVPVGLGLGRLANFVNSELLGKVVAAPGQPAPWWAVKFPREIVSEHAVPLTPEQQQAIARIVRDVSLPRDSFEQGFERLIDKIQHGSHDLAARLEPYVSARHPSQLYQAFAEGLVLLGILWLIASRPRKPGVTGAWFLIAYGVLRITTEFWRLPDVGVQKLMGLSRGQQLSALMVVVGLAALALVARRAAAKNPGWRRKTAA